MFVLPDLENSMDPLYSAVQLLSVGYKLLCAVCNSFQKKFLFNEKYLVEEKNIFRYFALTLLQNASGTILKWTALLLVIGCSEAWCNYS